MAKKESEITEDDGLLVMEKDGEEIRVHPDQVALWQSQGWKVQAEAE